MSTPIDPKAFHHLDPAMEEGIPEAYPIVAWVYGNRQIRETGEISYTGGWFLDAEQAPMDPMPEPWTPWERPVASGALIDGWASPYLHVAVLRQRRCWYWVAGDQRRMYPYTQFDRCKANAAQQGVSPNGRLQLLVALPKVETPMVLTFKGAGSQAIAGTRRTPGVLARLDGELVGGLRRLLRQEASRHPRNPVVPRCAFWVTLGAQSTRNEPHFVKVGSGQQTQIVTLPVIHHLQGKSFETIEDFQPFYVGPQRLEQFQTWFQQTETWARAWDAEALLTPSSVGSEDMRQARAEGDSEFDPAYAEAAADWDTGVRMDDGNDIPF
ncbi:MAG: hypothetical protein OEU26_30985 [Candidatus Tectomicrobia bacterium]|nr:hypothetical protein [Candidatus Tectomicrobia bacterium]